MKTTTTLRSLRPPTVGITRTPHSSGAVAPPYGQRQTCGLFWKTQLCSKWKATGKCPKKDQCTFAHSLAELRDLPDLRCTKWCRRVFRGLPCEDLECPYAHSREQLRCNSHQLLAFKTALCKFYAKGICLSGEACRFAHTLKELRSPNAANTYGVEAGSGNSRQVHHIRQAPGRQSRSSSKTSAKRGGGDSSGVCSRKQKTTCRHGNYRVHAKSCKGSTDCTGRLPFSGKRSKDHKAEHSRLCIKSISQPSSFVRVNEKASDSPSIMDDPSSIVKELFRPADGPEIPASTAHQQKGQQSFEREQVREDAQGISTCEATEILPGITRSSTSRTSSRSSSISFGPNEAETESRPAKLPQGNELARPDNSKVGTAAQHVRKRDHKRDIRRVVDTESGTNIKQGGLVACSPEDRPIRSKFKDSKGAQEALKAETCGGYSPVPPSSSHDASISVPDLTSAATVTASSSICRIYTKVQLLAVRASFKPSQHFAKIYEGDVIADDGIKVTEDLTFRVVSCDENSGGRLETDVTHLHGTQMPVPGETTEATLEGRHQLTWPTSSTLSEVTASKAENHLYQPFDPQSSCNATHVAAPAVPFSQAARPCVPDQVSSRSSSPGAVSPTGVEPTLDAQTAATGKSRGSPDPAVCSATRVPYNIPRVLRTAPRRAANSTNVSFPVYPVNVQSFSSVTPPPQENCRIDPPTRRLPPAALLLYTQALEAAVIAAATWYRSLEGMRTDEEASVSSNVNTRQKNEADVPSFSYVDTWDLQAKSMALVTLAALCRLALLPPQQTQLFGQRTSAPSSLSVLGTRLPQFATIMEHLAALTTQVGISQHLHEGNIYLGGAGEPTRLNSCNAGVGGVPDCQERPRLTSQSEIEHPEQPPDQQQQSFLLPEVSVSAETDRAEQLCAKSCGTDNLNARENISRGCPRCLFLAALREHQLLMQHTNMSPSSLNPLEFFFQRIASGCCSNPVDTSSTDGFTSSVTGDEEKHHPPPPELVASLLRYVQVASDLQQARAF